MKTVASKENPAYKSLAKLVNSAAERRKRGLTVVEGLHLVEACLKAGHVVASLMVSDSACGDAEVARLLLRAGKVSVTRLSDKLFQAVSTLPSSAGILAVVATPSGRPVPADAGFCLLLEDVQDPGNVGTLLRSAAAAGAEHVLLSPSCAFAWSPKVLRAGQGAHFALNIAESADLAGFLATWKGKSVALASDASTSIFDVDIAGPIAFLVGNEGAGLSRDLLKVAGMRARIPMPGAAESLNAGVAGSIALFEAVRQRKG